MWVLVLTLLIGVGIGGYSLYKWWQTRPTFKYKDVSVWYDKPIRKTPERDAALVKSFAGMVEKGYFDNARAEELFKLHYKKVKKNKYIETALKKGIDTFYERFPDHKPKNVKCRIQQYPISHNAAGRIIIAHGISYADNSKIWVPVFPEERGGWFSLASVMVHEMNHIRLYEVTPNRQSDRDHTDLSWALADKRVDM